MQGQKIAAIILAAGESTRMGQLKQLLPWAGQTLIEWQVAQMLEASVDDVVVVLGHEADTIGRALVRTPARIAVNDGYKEGRASSVRCGAAALAEETDAVVILSVDQPRPAWVSRCLIERWHDTQAPLVIPTFNGRRGHPILLDGSLIGELRQVTEAELGLRAITDRHADETTLLPIDKAVINIDLNTPSDLESASAGFASGAWTES